MPEQRTKSFPSFITVIPLYKLPNYWKNTFLFRLIKFLVTSFPTVSSIAEVKPIVKVVVIVKRAIKFKEKISFKPSEKVCLFTKVLVLSNKKGEGFEKSAVFHNY